MPAGSEKDCSPSTGPDTQGKVTICHATGSATNPFVVITPSASGVYHGHLGSSHQDGRDIIPPFTYNGQTYSQNWDAEGQAMWATGCQPPVVQGSTDEQPCDKDTSMTAAEEADCAPGVVVKGKEVDKAKPADSVLGKFLSKGKEVFAAAGAVLPFTGGAVIPFVVIALILVAVGAFLITRKRRV
jgi:hypothetical protein